MHSTVRCEFVKRKLSVLKWNELSWSGKRWQLNNGMVFEDWKFFRTGRADCVKFLVGSAFDVFVQKRSPRKLWLLASHPCFRDCFFQVSWQYQRPKATRAAKTARTSPNKGFNEQSSGCGLPSWMSVLFFVVFANDNAKWPRSASFAYFGRRRHCLSIGYKGFQLVAQHCFVASFGSMFRVFHLAWSPCRATKTFVAVWRNAARWLVDLLGVNKRQVASLMKDELQSQRRPGLYFSQKLSSTPTSWSHNAKNAKHRPKTCNETMLRDKLKVFVSCISLP